MGALRRKRPDLFAKGYTKAITDFCNELGVHHVSQTVKCFDNKGNAYWRTMSKVVDVDHFLREVGLIGDDGEVPNLVISADGSLDKLIIVVWKADEPNAEPFLLCAIDNCHENRANIKMMLQSLGLPWKYKGKDLYYFLVLP